MEGAIIQHIAQMETERTTFGEPLLHAEVVLLNRTELISKIVDSESCRRRRTVVLLFCLDKHTVDKQNNHI